MKAKVIMSFKDKNTKEIYQPGQEIEVTKERFEDLTSTAQGPFLEKANKAKKQKVGG